MSKHKIVVYVPQSHAAAIRAALAEAGAGKIGDYSSASFSSVGTGRFRPEAGANPAIGEIGKLEEVLEEKIETICDSAKVLDVIAAIKKVHPYEEPAIDAWQLTYPE